MVGACLHFAAWLEQSSYARLIIACSSEKTKGVAVDDLQHSPLSTIILNYLGRGLAVGW